MWREGKRQTSHLEQARQLLDVLDGSPRVHHAPLVGDHRVAPDQRVARDCLPEHLNPENISYQVLRLLPRVSVRACVESSARRAQCCQVSTTPGRKQTPLSMQTPINGGRRRTPRKHEVHKATTDNNHPSSAQSTKWPKCGKISRWGAES